jgi:SNF2 family DNA or RNA helicase
MNKYVFEYIYKYIQIYIYILQQSSNKEENETNSDHRKGGLNYNNVLMQLRKICNHPYLVLESVLTLPDDLYYKVNGYMYENI